MNADISTTHGSPAADQEAVRALYRGLMDAWNRRSASAFAALFLADGSQVGFDGSQAEGTDEIAAHLGAVFADHETAAYVTQIRSVRILAPQVALLRAVAGMVPPGQADINPAVNAVHALVAVEQDGAWQIAHFQNTPAQFHGRPDLAEALTAELRAVLRAGGGIGA
jgi:uncharacterized protein (TIGR02246 family)